MCDEVDDKGELEAAEEETVEVAVGEEVPKESGGTNSGVGCGGGGGGGGIGAGKHGNMTWGGTVLLWFNNWSNNSCVRGHSATLLLTSRMNLEERIFYSSI